MLSLFLAAALGQLEPAAPEGPVVSQPSQMYAAFWSADYAFFEFAPTSGAGMTAACACTTPTGAKGEALTFTRTGAATCAKQANATTGILAGDLVVCASDNQPRVEYVNGSPSLRVELAATNYMVRSAEPSNAAWTKEAGVSVSADDVACPAAPDGTQTADLVTYAGASGTGFYQAATTPLNSVVSHSIYVARRTSGGAACTLRLADGYTAGAGTVVTVPAAGAGWTHAQNLGFTTVGTVAGLYLKEQTAGDCTDVCVWGAQMELRSQATRMIPTVAAAATRNVEVPLVTLPVAMPMATLCVGATVDLTGSPTTGIAHNFVEPSQNIASGDVLLGYVFSGNRRVDLVGSAVRQNSVAGVTPPFGSGATRYVSRFDGATLDFYQNATSIDSDTGAAITMDPAGYIYIGVDNTGGGQLNGNIWNVQVDPSPSRCTL